MNFEHLITDDIGLIHFLGSVLALVFGSLVLFMHKGTQRHKTVGYCYVGSMGIVLITAFMMYNLYGTFGIFHWAAVVSSITIVGGMLPMIIKRPKSYISLHYNFMYWSVFGLYGAFMAEVLVRIPKVVVESGIPNHVFYNMVGIAVFITMGIGYLVMWKKKNSWSKFDTSLTQ